MPVIIVFISLAIYNKSDSCKNIFIQGVLHAPYILIYLLVTVVPLLIISKVFQYFHVLAILPISIVLIYIDIKMSFTNYLIVLENNKPIEAIKNSFKYTDKYIGKIILVFITIGIPLGVIDSILSYINNNIFKSNFLTIFTIDVINNILFTIFYVSFFHVYYLSWIERNPEKIQK